MREIKEVLGQRHALFESVMVDTGSPVAFFQNPEKIAADQCDPAHIKFSNSGGWGTALLGVNYCSRARQTFTELGQGWFCAKGRSYVWEQKNSETKKTVSKINL